MADDHTWQRRERSGPPSSQLPAIVDAPPPPGGGPHPTGGKRNRLIAVGLLLLAAALFVFVSCRGDGARKSASPDPNPGSTSELVPEGRGPDVPGDVAGTGRAIHVAANAAPGGDGSIGAPLPTIQAALDLAKPGEAIRVGPGTYPGTVRSVRPGTAERPIWLVGDRAKIVPPTKGGDSDSDSDEESEEESEVANPGRLVVIAHDRVVLDGFEISGGDINLFVFKANYVRILRNNIHDAKGECVRVKYFSSYNEIANNRIDRCGLTGFDVSEDEKNGEGIYIGTAPEQRKKKNPTKDPDQSNQNHVHDNTINSPAECVDIKEAARGNLVERNTCRGGRDPDGAGFSSRGIGTVFRDNSSTDNVGAGIRLGGDEESDGIDSIVRDNRLLNNGGYGVKIEREPQEAICGNVVEDNRDGPAREDDPDPTRPCPA